MVKLRVILMLLSMFVAIYALFHFTRMEDEMNDIIMGSKIEPKPFEPQSIKISSHTKGHFALVFYPTKPKNEIIYIDGWWKKTAEFEVICEIEKNFPPNWSKNQIKENIISEAKKKKANAVVVNYLSTEYKVEK